MSEDIQKGQPGLRLGGIYTLFSILIPFLLYISIDYTCRDFLHSLNTVPWWFFFIALACGIAVSRVFILVTGKRAGYSSLLRITCFIYFPAVCIVVFFLYKTPFLIIYECSLLFIQWIITFYIFNGCKEYMQFIKLVQNHPGQFLVAEIHTHSIMIQDSYEGLKKIRRIIYALQFVLFLFVSILFLAGIQLRLPSLLLSTGSIVSGLAFGITINTRMDEYRFYIDGLSIGEKLKRKRLSHVFIILILSFLLVLPLLRNNSIFTPVDILKFFQWFVDLFPENKLDMNVPEDFTSQNWEDWSRIRKLLNQNPDQPPIFDMILFIEIFGKALAVLLVAGLLYFLFKPLIEKGLRGLLKGKRPFKNFIITLKHIFLFLKKTTGEIFRTIISFLRPSKNRKHFTPTENKADSRSKPERMSLKKRIQKNRVLKAFIILIKWGIKQRINFHPALGPKEYINLITEKIPGKKDILEFIADTFEEAVFSDHIIKTLTIKNYVQEIKAITGLR